MSLNKFKERRLPKFRNNEVEVNRFLAGQSHRKHLDKLKNVLVCFQEGQDVNLTIDLGRRCICTRAFVCRNEFDRDLSPSVYKTRQKPLLVFDGWPSIQLRGDRHAVL